MAKAPLTLVLEFSRASEAGDEFAFRFEEQDYVRRDADGSVENATFPWSEEVLSDLAALQRAKPDRAAAQRLGDRLRAFLAKLSWKADEERIVEALEAKRPVHITVRSAAAEIYALPFELITLRSTGQHLGELPGCLLRYEWPATRTAPRVPDPPPEGGRILFAWSAAGGAVPASAHLSALRRACSEGHHPFDEGRDVLPHASRDKLSAALADKANPVAVLHLLCHGGATTSATPSYGLLWNGGSDDDGPDVVDAASLRQLLAPHAGSLRLVVLCACHGGGSGALGNHLGSVAQMLHRIGIPAVIASRYPFSVEGSNTLAEALYRRLLVNLSSLEAALLTVRERLAERTDLFDWASIQLYARASDGADHRPFAIRPYRGLVAFQPVDRRFFFGREKEVEELLTLLRAGQRLVAVVGASGSGKSSLVLAGLVPKLEDGALGEGAWRVRIMRPGAAPCQTLAAVLATADVADRPPVSLRSLAPPELVQEIVRHREALAVEGERLLGGKAGTQRLLLVVDQFEEVFTQAGAAGEVKPFIDNLLHATAVAGGRVHVLLTLRGDFYGHCLDNRQLAERIPSSQVIALPMKALQIREAIERPADLVGLRFEGGIVDALVDALREGAMGGTISGAAVNPLSSTNLPLLQFALEELWKQRSNDCIVWGAWKRIGGVRGALEKRANELLEDFPAEEDRAAIRNLFGRLVQLGEGTADTRRYAPRKEIEDILGKRADEVLGRWIAARLLVTDESGEGVVRIGVAHEALIREWQTLRRWISESRDALRLRQELSQDAQRWESHRKSADDLWRGGRLKRMVEVQEQHKLPLSANEQEFLEASKDAERKVEEEKRRAEEEKRQEKLRAEEEKRQEKLRVEEEKRRWLRISFGIVVVLLVIAVGLAFDAHRQKAKVSAEKDRADENATEAKNQTALAQKEAVLARDATRIAAARSALDNDPTIALLLLRDLEQPMKHMSWVETALQALWRPESELILHHELALTAVAYSPKGDYALTASEDKHIKFWAIDHTAAAAEKNGNQPALDKPIVFPYPVDAAAWSPDGARVLALGHDGSLWVSLASGEGERLQIRHGDGIRIRAALWSPDGKRLLTAATDKKARICMADGSGEVVALPHDSEITAIAWSPQGDRVVTASEDGIARVWPAAGPGEPVVLKGHQAAIVGVAFSPDGKRVATASKDNTARVWSADGKGKAVTLKGHEEPVVSVAWSPDGKQVVTASRDKTARVWPADGKGKAVILRGHEGVLLNAFFSVDGTRILTTSDGQTPRVWRADGLGIEVQLQGHQGSIVAAAWSSDGEHVVTASTDKTARVWDPDSTDDLGILKRYTAKVSSASWSPDDKLILAVLDDGTARVSSDTSLDQLAGKPASPDGRGEKVLKLPDKGRIRTAAFSRDGARVLTVSDGDTAQVWTVEGALTASLEGHEKPIALAVWSPDGKRVATASDDGTARIWEAPGGAPLATLKHEARVTVLAWSADGSRLLTASDDNTSRVWTSDGKSTPIKLPHASPVQVAAWSPDGRFIVTVSEKDGAQLWPSDGGVPLPIEEAAARVRAVGFSPDGQRVVTASDENKVRLWPIDLKSGPPLVLVGTSASLSPDGTRVLTTPRSFPRTARVYLSDSDTPIQLKGHEDTVRSVVWSSDGKRVLTGSADGTLRIWLLDRELLLKAMCRVTRARLNDEELELHLNASYKRDAAAAEPCSEASR